ncbi:MAG: ATP-binding protein [Bryobacteraceae bacterium]
MAATALAMALIAGLGWYVWTSVQTVRSLRFRTFEAVAGVGEIRGLNAAVMGACRLQAAGEPSAGAGCEELRDRRRVLAANLANQFSAGRARMLADTLDGAVRSLESVEAEALNLARSGQARTAGMRLIAPEYTRALKQADETATALAAQVESVGDVEVRAQYRLGRFVIVAVSLAILLLVFTWVIGLRISGGLVARRQREEWEQAELHRRNAFVAAVREALADGESLESVADTIRNHLPVELCQIWIRGRRKEGLLLEASSPRNGLGPEWIPVVAAEMQRVADSRDPQAMAELDLADGRITGLKDAGWRVVLGCPLRLGERTIGVIGVFSRTPVSELHRTSLQTTSDLIAQGIERAHAEALTVQYAKDLEQANRRLEDQAAKVARTAQELALARDAALESVRLKSQFLASVSHEIRTPMTGIIGMTDLTLETDLTTEQHEYVSLIKSSAQSLLTLINGILDFSKIESGKIELEKLRFSLRDTVMSALRPLSQRAFEKGLSFRIHVAPEVPRDLVGDPNRFRQILVNLAGNAIKFTDRGEVTVDVIVESQKHHQSTIQVSVADTGIGIPKEKRTLIFQPFTQADGSTTRRFGGTGLGLAICQQLVRSMGGRISVEGQPGVGSIFTFAVPFGIADALPAPEPQEPQVRAKSGTEDRYRLLLAEDNPVSQKLVARLLEKCGHTVVSVGTGLEAMEALDREAFDAVLMNLQMPALGGLEATAAIRQREKERPFASGPHIPIIATTASAMKGDRDRCLGAGMDGYVSKPIRREDLFDAIELAIRQFPRARSAASVG